MTIYPVILSGGSGTRLWPMSREDYPKQLMPLAGPRTLFQDTVARVSAPEFSPPVVVCNDAHRFIIGEQIREVGREPAVLLLEPHARNTAPAAAVAALWVHARDPEGVLALMPSDHLVTDTEAFRTALSRAAKVAAGRKAMATLGITPRHPETGYGYIRAGQPLSNGATGLHRVERFVEKPDAATAERFLAEGGYYWNSGIFVFPAARYIAELERLRPEMLDACRKALAKAKGDLDFCRLDADAFGSVKGESIDYAVMEHVDDTVVLPVDMGWNDVGAWSALWDVGRKDGAGNVAIGDVVTQDTSNSYIRSNGPLTTVLGLDDVAVVVTDDAVLVAAKDRVQEVKTLVETLRAKGREEVVSHPTVYRPWGSYRGIDAGPNFQVKHITVKPGQKLSLQMHHHRAEHWVVVRGTAKVTNGNETFLLHENQSTYIPLGRTHRLENPGKLPLSLIEVQSGSYLGEDDIIRMEDAFGRA
ncbi:mannose-1-phosphate guanylyltransferase/mannose-6-phosphate isomerase [Novispirillum sp. DQ9]|uniref:mannose-1-phosphate guanylyltransferase/mannose-6-phosphate isomerase n=1 Tax=Novispirillum sp. DQ9 TaxID=3398612 RepID=UPI003C7CAD71